MNRANEISRNDNQPNITVGLYEIDEIIKFYFDNVIKPTVKEANQELSVPIIYGSPERWASIQKSGVFRDKKGKIQLPAIVYKRTSLEKNMIGSKIDPNNPVVRSFTRPYTKVNRYDNFSVLQGRKPIQEVHNIVVPDYVILKYSCIIWTSYLEHLNHIIEDVNYAANSYWGNDQFKFMAKIGSFSTDLSAELGKDRFSKCEFEIDMNGYIIPNNMQKYLSNYKPKEFTKAKLIVNGETAVNADDYVDIQKEKESKKINR
jgi:hypothetical protein|tara:strand:- start:482 stop:1261 length:780 start_codon:yes stop_codon:yes gene_type:complete